jgi:glycosyltransferase involved in cell wall biosynthesis
VKILLVHNKYQQPGGEDVVFEQERKLLAGAGHEVVTYCRTNDDVKDSSLLQRISLVKNTVHSQTSRNQVAEILQKKRFDVAHIHNTFMVISPAIYSACKDAGVPMVQTLHNYRLLCPGANFYRDGHTCEECTQQGVWHSVRYGCYRDSKAATATVALMLTIHRRRETWAQINSFIALSEFARRKFIDGGLPAEQISVKPNFVQPDPGERTNGGGGYAIYVGRLSSEKGPGTMIAAWKQLPQSIPLVVVGDGPLLAELQTQCREDNLPNVSFRGRLPREQAQALLKGADFAILPSECYESFPMTMAESFACGVPVICSRLGSLQELVQDGKTGLHFSSGSPQDLATKVDWAWNNPGAMCEMGKAARKDFEAHYTAEKNYPLLMQIYEQAIANQRGTNA